jgi:hypothetical protein
VTAYLLLAIPTVRVPVVARRFADHAEKTNEGGISFLRVAGLYTLTCGVFIFLWCHATAILIRPVFTFSGHAPTVSAIAPLQRQWEWLVALSIMTALLRFVGEAKLARSPSFQGGLNSEHVESLRKQGVLVRIPLQVRIAGTVAASILLLSGMYEGWLDAVVVALVITVIALLRSRQARGSVKTYVLFMTHVPALIRLVAACTFGFLASFALLELFWKAHSFRPVLVGALITTTALAILFPSPKEIGVETPSV